MVRLDEIDSKALPTLGATGNKRSRPQSSLDYQADPKQHLLHPEAKSSKNKDRAVLNEEGETDMNYGAGRVPGEGESRRSLSLADLEGMSEEEIIQAIYNDPELATLAAEHAQSRRAAGGDRVDLLKEQGIPYQQWGIVLVILGIGFYQLYKTLKPASSTKQKSQKNGTSSNKRSTKRNNSKAKGGETTKGIDIEYEQVVADLSDAIVKQSDPNKKPVNNKKKKKKVKPAKAATESAAPAPKPTPAPVVAKKKPIIQPVEEIDDGGEWTTVEKSSSKKAEVASENDAETVHTSNTTKAKKKDTADKVEVPPLVEEEQTAESTVGAVEVEKADHTDEKKENGTSNKAISPEPADSTPAEVKDTVEPEKKDDDEAVAAPQVEEKSAQEKEKPQNGAPKPEASKKSKKKKKNNAKDSTEETKTDVVSKDAELAQKLQQEEERLAAALQEVRERDANHDESEGAGEWEEVSTKKKKTSTGES